LALAAAAALGHALITSIRRRRRDLSILKTLGFLRRQVSATVAWQATTVATIALVVGIPIGIAAGRWAWTLFARQLGVAAKPVAGWWAVLLAIPATWLVANVVAAIPGRAAARMQPAAALRSE
jgi:predicted lysophospholipase L1 biosynthesis ABC-type transport system permease subunit